MRGTTIATVVAALALSLGCEEGGGPFANLDAHSDTWVPDGSGPCVTYTDSDGDTIPDSIEGSVDTDGDTVPNYLDDDSDGDGISDATEAGDSDLCTAPANTDWGFDSSGNPKGDEKADFVDLDSDNDGVSDHDEAFTWGTDPTASDSDGDGVTDLGEIAAGTDPNDITDTIDPEDFFVILPYMAPNHELRNLAFGTDLQVADVYFLVDTTGSMDSAIINVASSLSGTIVPAIRSEIDNVQMGAGHFTDMPCCGHGDSGDQPFFHIQSITTDDAAVQAAVQYMATDPHPWGSGADWSESDTVALYLTATGDGFTDCSASVPAQTCYASPDEIGARHGYPCFRPDALPIVVLISDAPWHNGFSNPEPYTCTTTSYTDALTALTGIGARMIGVTVSSWGSADAQALADMQAMATDTGAVDAMGNPLVEVADSGSVSTGIVDMIATLANATPQDVSAIPRDEPDDPPGLNYDATIFVKDITPESGSPDIPVGFSGMDEDFFFDVVPGTLVTFEIDFYNNTVMPLDSAQVFKAWIAVIGNSVALLDRRMVIIIVPTEGMGDIFI